MFNEEFYPTPPEVIEMLGLDVDGKIVMEPHAGSGNFLDFLKKNGASRILCCEKDKKLALIARTKGEFLKHDFFEVMPEEIGHVQMIVMNPPFSNADDHIVHAWKIAPEGCEIVSLCNYETINKNYRYGELAAILNNYGFSENLGDCFKKAERKTGVEIGLIKLYKPIISSKNSYDGFFMDEDDDDNAPQIEGMMRYNEVRALVQRYVGAMRTFDLMKEQLDMLDYSLKELDLQPIKLEIEYDKKLTSKEDFGRYLQKVSWQYIFGKMKIEKYVTSGVMKDINNFVETQTKVPFTMRNIYRMFDIIVGTREQNLKRAIEEIMDTFTKHTHENRWNVEGWKTNSGYMLNRKFIANYVFSSNRYSNKNRIQVWSSTSARDFDDLLKVMCFLTGNNFDEFQTLSVFVSKMNGLMPNTWYSWGFFEIKGFKKGTIHCKFQNEDDWYKLNQAYAKIKGFTLPEQQAK